MKNNHDSNSADISHNKQSTLSLYAPGSFRELAVVAFPLILSALSANLMVFADRLVLARYNLTAMSAAAAAGIAAWIFILGGISIAAITEVFVGHHNGAGEMKKAAVPAWQMIWFSFATPLFFAPIAFWGAEYLIPTALHAEGIPYFRIILSAGVFITLSSALSGFFAGRGQTKIITIATIIGNVLNIALNIPFVFGIPGIIDPHGATGSAIATLIAQIIQAGILFSQFLSKKNRSECATDKPSFSLPVLKQCIFIGLPNAMGHVIELSAHTVIFHFAAACGSSYIAALTMGQNAFILFAFFNDGLQKGVTAIAANLIGGQNKETLRKLFVSASKLHLLAVGLLSIVILAGSSSMLSLFGITDTDAAGQLAISDITIVFAFVWLYILIDGFAWIFAGILTAAQDTLAVMTSNALASWLFLVVPAGILLTYYTVPCYTTWIFSCVYGIANMIFLGIRSYKHIWGRQSTSE